MKIALINENSQAAKNALIEATLRKVVEPMGHEVVNYGMYAADDAAQLTYVQNGILAAVLLNSGAADYVITGCGTGEGAMLALNSLTPIRFTIRNTGNTALTGQEGAVITDTFDPILNITGVTFNGTAWTSPEDYTYDAATGAFATVAGKLTVPEAAFTQNADGSWTVTPGQSVLTVTGTV